MNSNVTKLSKEEKRLDVVVKFFYPVVAGIETNILNIYSYLATQGWEVVIHTSTSTPDAPHSLPSTGEIRGLSIRRYRWHWYGFIRTLIGDDPARYAFTTSMCSRTVGCYFSCCS
jgi:hypothetical protein